MGVFILDSMYLENIVFRIYASIGMFFLSLALPSFLFQSCGIGIVVYTWFCILSIHIEQYIARSKSSIWLHFYYNYFNKLCIKNSLWSNYLRSMEYLDKSISHSIMRIALTDIHRSVLWKT